MMATVTVFLCCPANFHIPYLNLCNKLCIWCIKLSSLHGSPIILVFWELNFFPEFEWEMGNQNMFKMAIFRLRGWITGKLLKVEAARRFTTIESLSHPCDICGNCHWGISSGNQNVLKVTIFAPVRLSHAGIAETGQRKYPPFLPIRLIATSSQRQRQLLVNVKFSCILVSVLSVVCLLLA